MAVTISCMSCISMAHKNGLFFFFMLMCLTQVCSQILEFAIFKFLGMVLWGKTEEITGCSNQHKKQTNSMVRVRERTLPTERPPLVGEWLPTFADRGCHVDQINIYRIIWNEAATTVLSRNSVMNYGNKLTASLLILMTIFAYKQKYITLSLLYNCIVLIKMEKVLIAR
jgi:hypothetical protein